MLLDRANALQASLQEHLAVKAAGTQAQVFKTRAALFSPLAKELKDALGAHTALMAAGLNPQRPAPRPALRAQANDLLTRFEADRNALAQADEKLRFEFTQGIKNAAAELQQTSLEAWTAAVAVHENMPNDDVLQALEHVSAYREPVHRVRSAAQKLQHLRGTLPGPAELPTAMTGLAAAGRELEAGLGALQSDELPKGVLAFLRKSGQGGAALEDLTDEVRAWLDQRGLASSFRILPSARPL